MEVVVHVRGDRRELLKDTARARLALALANEVRQMTTMDIRAFIFRSGLAPRAHGGCQKPAVSRAILGKVTAYFFALKDEPDAVPGWRVELDTSGSRPRLRCVRIAPASA